MINKLNNYLLFFIFLVFLIFIRLNTVSYEIISWDEATYIIAGQEILNGFLPYENLYEMKPPLLYYLYSLPLFFHKSLESVRIFGLILIFISSISLFYILIKYVEKKIAFIVSLGFISIFNYYFWLETSSEIVILPLLLLSFICFRNYKKSYLSLIFLGLLISISTLVRLNIGILGFFIFLYMIFDKYECKKTKFYNLIIYVLSGLLPLLFLIYFYYYHGKINLFYTGTFEVPLVYSSEKNFLDGTINYLRTIFKLSYFNPINFGTILISFVLSVFKPNILSEDNGKFNVYYFGIIFTTILAGQGFSHHLIVLIPFVLIFSFTKIIKNSFVHNCKLLLFFVLISTQVIYSISPNIDLINNKYNFSLDYKIKEIANSEIMKDKKVLALDYHLFYFYNNYYYPSKIIHTPAWVRVTTKDRLRPLININYISHDEAEVVLSHEYDYILCSSRICEEGRKTLDNEKIKLILKDFKEFRRIKKYSKWEHTKYSDLILYKNLKKSE